MMKNVTKRCEKCAGQMECADRNVARTKLTNVVFIPDKLIAAATFAERVSNNLMI
jgi:hypothetical protein